MNDCLAIQDKKEETFLYRIFISHPELNASAVARRMGISQSLMSQIYKWNKKALTRTGGPNSKYY